MGAESGNDYTIKWEKHIALLPFYLLDSEDQNFIKEQAYRYQCSHQDLRKIIEMALELKQWQRGPLSKIWPSSLIVAGHDNNRPQQKKKILIELDRVFLGLKQSGEKYTTPCAPQALTQTFKVLPQQEQADGKIMGLCPVASPKTLCCNLQTLDVIMNCAFDCSYCSIQTFNDDKIISYKANILEQLKKITFDAEKIYHIGTGQASDSLFLGNKENILGQLMDFARANPNVILEFKTKSDRIEFFLQEKIPRNVILTWSLNPQIVIDHEEHKTASLEQRLKAAEQVANKGILVGFHFHPMMFYNQASEDYANIAQRISKSFDPSGVAMVSMGALTFTKKTMNYIRTRPIQSKILQMPMEEVAGKFSYPEKIKIDLFHGLYQNFKSWHEKVFFYLCMEESHLWPPVFGHKHADNEDFERQMKKSYMGKIKERES